MGASGYRYVARKRLSLPRGLAPELVGGASWGFEDLRPGEEREFTRCLSTGEREQWSRRPLRYAQLLMAATNLWPVPAAANLQRALRKRESMLGIACGSSRTLFWSPALWAPPIAPATIAPSPRNISACVSPPPPSSHCFAFQRGMRSREAWVVTQAHL
jgi:hypothetical protein